QDRLICLNAGVSDPRADPGFQAGDSPRSEATAIAAALASRSPTFIVERCGTRKTLLMPLPSKRRHDLGWIGFTTASSTPPSVQELPNIIGRFEDFSQVTEVA